MPIIMASGADTEPQVVITPRGWVRLDFCSLDGTDCIEWGSREWVSLAGLTGVDSPPEEPRTSRRPGMAGAFLDETGVLERDMLVPLRLWAQSGSGMELRARLARLRRMVTTRGADVSATDGTFDLVAVTESSWRSLRCTYVSGLEGDYSPEVRGDSWQTVALRLLAVDPWWRGEMWSSPIIRQPETSVYLSNDGTHPWPRRLSSGIALGREIPVRVGGDVPSPASATLTSPWSSVRITSPQGLDLSLGPVSTAGHTVRIDTGRRKRVLLDGVPAWTLLKDPIRWEPLPPGEARITIDVQGAAASTSAVVTGWDLWESGW